MKEHIIHFELGDYSGDGHGFSDSFYKKSNYSVEQITEAYAKAVNIVGVDLVEDVCTDYEDYHVTQEQYDKLLKHGLIEEEEDVEDFYIDIDLYLDIFEAMIKLVLKDFWWIDFPESCENLDILNGAGYGITCRD